MTEGDIYIAISLFIIWTIGFVAFRRMRARQKAEQLAMEEKIRAFREREASRQQSLVARAKMKTSQDVANLTQRVVETKAHRDRYADRRVVVDNSDDIMLQNMLIMNAISQPEPAYVSCDNVSRSSTYDYSSSDSSSSYSSYDSSSSSDSGSSSSCD